MKKPLSGIIFSQNGMIQAEKEAEKEKKNLIPNSVRIRPGQENSKKNSKKIQKIKQVNSGIISIQNGQTEAEKEKKKI